MTNDTECLSCFNIEADVIDDLAVFNIGEGNIIKANVTFHIFNMKRIGSFANFRLGVHDLKKSLERVGAVRCHVGHFVEELQRRIDHADRGDERNEVGVVEMSLDNEPTAETEGDQVTERVEQKSGERANEGVEGCALRVGGC